MKFGIGFYTELHRYYRVLFVVITDKSQCLITPLKWPFDSKLDRTVVGHGTTIEAI